MKILYDHQIFGMQKFGGISRYFAELFDVFQKDETISVSLLISENNYAKQLPTFYFNIKGSNSLKFFKYLCQIINELKTLSALLFHRWDIFHPTYYNPYFLKLFPRIPYVVTVHDMIHEKFPKKFHRRDFTSKWKREIVENAKKIIAVSESTKKDLIELFDIPAEKITVIYHGNSIVPHNNSDKTILEKLGTTGKYLLFVGQRGGYKNFHTFIDEVSPIIRSSEALKLLCVGGGTFSAHEKDFLSTNNISHRVVQVNVSDSELATLYSNAELFVFPSLYEGFGIPILEAFACGCPVACSNKTSLPEVGGDAVALFDPTENGSIRKTIESVLEDTRYRNSLISRGYERVAEFTWKKTAEETKAVYEEVYRSKKSLTAPKNRQMPDRREKKMERAMRLELKQSPTKAGAKQN